MPDPSYFYSTFKEISTHEFVSVLFNKKTQQHALFSLRSFKEGEAICFFSEKEIHTQPNYLTIQISLKQHISLFPDFLQYTNHSCDPNVFFDTDKMRLIAIKNISKNEELCFFYPSTELNMSQPFLCNCRSEACLKEIKGAMFIDKGILNKYRLNSFIKKTLSI